MAWEQGSERSASVEGEHKRRGDEVVLLLLRSLSSTAWSCTKRNTIVMYAVVSEACLNELETVCHSGWFLSMMLNIVQPVL